MTRYAAAFQILSSRALVLLFFKTSTAGAWLSTALDVG